MLATSELMFNMYMHSQQWEQLYTALGLFRLK